MKTFSMKHRIFESVETFTEETAPDWITGKNTIKGSTHDNRWFWVDHVMTLNIGQSVETNFRTITRIS